MTKKKRPEGFYSAIAARTKQIQLRYQDTDTRELAIELGVSVHTVYKTANRYKLAKSESFKAKQMAEYYEAKFDSVIPIRRTFVPAGEWRVTERAPASWIDGLV